MLWHSCLYSIIGGLIKQEEVVEQQTLPGVFDKAIWTFSDSRYAEHRALDLPVQGVFVSASPASFNASVVIRLPDCSLCDSIVLLR